MFSANSFPLFIVIVILVSIESNNGIAVGSRQRSLLPRSSSDVHVPTHLNFFRAGFRGRTRVLSCANDASICLDGEKNPRGGRKCCFQQCKDVLRDSNNCGECGKVCGYGFVCCNGKCVDLLNDPRNCGSCSQQCPRINGCTFAMCDYGG
ncbi:hypothetical protein V6N13_082353 [Hibiscus sabdariffa]|uniref:Stigma-specific Stig1 family protein n=1 Tax=Hibiscus sabdariffa TaxID=183260 RepID=A0ABR2Q355_9ROSI